MKVGCPFVTKQSFGLFVNQASNTKVLLQKLFNLVCYWRISNEKLKLSCNLVMKQSFGHEPVILSFIKAVISHFLNEASNQKNSLTKIVQFGMLFEKGKI